MTLIFAGAALLLMAVIVITAICVMRYNTVNANAHREETMRMVLQPQRWWRSNINIRPTNQVHIGAPDDFRDDDLHDYGFKGKIQRPAAFAPIADAWL